MVNSKKLLPSDLLAFVEAKLKNWVQPGQHVTLALSGGVDSVVLLDVLMPLGTSLNFHLSALYVNHQISPNAAHWAKFCAGLCAGRGVPFAAVKVNIAHHPGESLEALARAARYRVFLEQKTDFVVLAQHLDDQAETLMLQLLRGAGAKGLSAMGELSTGILRPLLDVPRQTILDYAKAHNLEWVEDESNADIAFDRNYLRHQVMPLLARRFPGYRQTFARTSRNLADCVQLMDDLARLDCAVVEVDGRLRVNVLAGLTAHRARNLLRFWLSGQGVPTPSAGRLENMMQQLCSSRDDAQVRIHLGDAIIRRYRGEIYIEQDMHARQHGLCLPWALQETLDLPGLGGRLCFEHMVGRGLSQAKLVAGPVTVRLRQGGERLRPDCHRPSRSLKNLLQEAGIPPWQRQRLPLLFSGERLVCVSGIGVECDYQAAEGEPGVVVKFEV
ncbi:MAG: tRNA lysidine(34) synthetase TilS [Sulfuricella sp.]|nr:tRNA lysidine(34) synthetase TilS [Sulfuricella sp.]